MPAAIALELSITQFDLGVFAASRMNSSSESKKRNSFSLTPASHFIQGYNVLLSAGNSQRLVETRKVIPEEKGSESIATAIGRRQNVQQLIVPEQANDGIGTAIVVPRPAGPVLGRNLHRGKAELPYLRRLVEDAKVPQIVRIGAERRRRRKPV